MADKVSFVDAFVGEIIAPVGVAGTGVPAPDVRDMMPDSVAHRFGADRAPHPVERLSGNGSRHTARQRGTSRSPSASSTIVRPFVRARSTASRF
jgi:hypothetical protein